MDPKNSDSLNPSVSGSALIKSSPSSDTDTYSFLPLLSEVLASVEPLSAASNTIACPVDRASEGRSSSLAPTSARRSASISTRRQPYTRPGTLLSSLRPPRIQQSSTPVTLSTPPSLEAAWPVHSTTMNYTNSERFPGRAPSSNRRRVRFADLSLEDEPSKPPMESSGLIGAHPNTQRAVTLASVLEEIADDGFEQWISSYRTIPLGSCYRRPIDSDGALLVALMQQRQGNDRSLEDKAAELKEHLDRLCASGHLSREVVESLGMSPDGSLVLFDGTELPRQPSRPSDPPQSRTTGTTTAGGSQTQASRANGSSNCHVEVVINNAQ